MKKIIKISFNIYQDSLENQKPDFTIYSESIPDNLEKFTQLELENSGFKKMIKLPLKKRDMLEHYGRNYIALVTEEQLKELLDF